MVDYVTFNKNSLQQCRVVIIFETYHCHRSKQSLKYYKNILWIEFNIIFVLNFFEVLKMNKLKKSSVRRIKYFQGFGTKILKNERF